MIHLLDVNVLIALCDPAHTHAEPARKFFKNHLATTGWATCPIVENGFLRIFGARNYPGGPGSAQTARHILAGVVESPGHQFWPDDFSLMNEKRFPQLPPSKDLTDVYLLALAVANQSRFATFDAGLDASLIVGGPAAYQIIPAQ